MVKRMPGVAEKCLSHIPRIGALREILRRHTHNFAAGKKRSDTDLDEEIPWEARALKIARDFDLLDAGERMRNFSPELAIREPRGRFCKVRLGQRHNLSWADRGPN